MNFASYDNPLLVAPRPVRISSAPQSNRHHARRLLSPVSPSFDQFERVKIAEDADLDKNHERKLSVYTDASGLSEKDSSPRASPRPTPHEALEEFLSIIRPSFFPHFTTGPRNGRQSASLPNLQPSYDCSYPYTNRGRIELYSPAHDSGIVGDGFDSTKSGMTSRNDGNSENKENMGLQVVNDFSSRWYSHSTHSSPISRMQTRNPFQRHPSYETGLNVRSPKNHSPALMLSPAAIPLPLPTPDEFVEMS